MAIKGRHNHRPANHTDTGAGSGWATRRDLFDARAQSGNWVLAYVSPERIDPNPNQPRKQIEQAALEELKQSIASRGILQPLLGAKSNHSRVQLIAGHRRLQAARELGLARVPVVLVDQLNEEETVIDAVIENIQRRNLEAWEEGVAYAQLADEFGWTHDEIGRKIGKSRPYVSTRIRAAQKLSPLVKEVLATGNWATLRPTSEIGLKGTSVPASDKNHKLNVDQAGPVQPGQYEPPGQASAVHLNNVEVIRRLTTLSFERQEALLRDLEQRLNLQNHLSVKDVVELIKTGQSGGRTAPLEAPGESDGYQMSFVDLGLDELDLFHRWNTGNQTGPAKPLSVEELDRLIDLYEKDLTKLRRLRATRS